MGKYQGYLIDLDGTIYRGRQPIAAAHRFVKRLQDKNVPFAFLTNNTTKTPQQVVANLSQNHQINVLENQIITPSLATASYLIADSDDVTQKTCYIIGQMGLQSAIFATGIKYDENNPDYVIVGLDFDVTYHKFELATLAIKRGAKFIGTNADTNLPNERGLVPGAGSLISLVETATQQKAIYIGKPQRTIADYALKVKGWQRDKVAIIGDNYNTDIKCGLNSNIDTILVYTGVSTPEQVAQQNKQPTYQIQSLDEWDV
ncbi:TIGR01457 family HAD-type hydrolase [Bombilactobacillus bombi]|uniref:Acid sugar phosphatase n=1 Tax=Bombilactobacillus bombi TaxID=1303590 RepID=A0A3R6UZJ3_9LACO|nr:TIGR01457 family HAD-type hydrolase [Bombilactobacillus bombi]MCO6541414.1 TIGR01457 family HAD-type hydrolase [Lactobacillus sp.]RHW51762.1 TIGR01457 family HAD-type hydrolase [Bombilactobacillus bombi]